MTVIGSEPQWRLKLRGCRRCHTLADPLVFIDEAGDRIARPLFHEGGNLESDILFVFEAPNYSDTFDPDKGRMTTGEAADPTDRFFTDCLSNEVGIEPEQTMVVNSVLCLPARVDGRYPVCAEQRRHCSPNLRSAIENVDPRVVVTMGGAALEALKLIEHHRLELGGAAARPHEWFGRAFFPLYHPSNLGRVTRSADEQRADYEALRRFMEGE
jgi:uracil-DNA glycosylase family 4